MVLDSKQLEATVARLEALLAKPTPQGHALIQATSTVTQRQPQLSELLMRSHVEGVCEDAQTVCGTGSVQTRL